MQKKWVLKQNVDELKVKALADSLNISMPLARLLVIRGITTFFEAKKFFRPSLENLYDPFLFPEMNKAAMRIIKAIADQEKIFIYGDYDVDGACAASLMYLFLKELDADVEFYIPNRLTDGYGLAKNALDLIKSKGASLIITVDCGITGLEEAEYAKELNIDLIISDHHQPSSKLPEAYAIIDPLLPNCDYPFKYLSGAGVAFKIAQAIAKKIGKNNMPFKYLDLVAIANAADIVNLTDENRTLTQKGIELIRTNPRPGIQALIDISGLDISNLTSAQIVFSIAPRINAVGRLGEATPAIELFITNDKEEAKKYAQILENENANRRKIDEATFSQAVSLLEKSFDLERQKVIILHNDDWHAGVIGIVASRLVEKYYRPAIMLTTIDGVAKGSARSINGFNIYQALKDCEDLLLQFGGHEAAAGVSIEIGKIDELRNRLNAIADQYFNKKKLQPELEIESQLSFNEITPKFIRVLDQFSPYGPGNMKPVFLTENVIVASQPKIVGSNHLLLTLKQPKSAKVFDAIGYNLGHFIEDISKDTALDIVYSIETITKDGKNFPQFKLKDLRFSLIYSEK
jgi:single-stranded-DNA-specific exonuclease